MNENSWATTFRLATIVSLIAAVAAVLLERRLPEQVIIASIIGLASLVGWMNVDRASRPAQPQPLHLRRR